MLSRFSSSSSHCFSLQFVLSELSIWSELSAFMQNPSFSYSRRRSKPCSKTKFETRVQNLQHRLKWIEECFSFPCCKTIHSWMNRDGFDTQSNEEHLINNECSSSHRIQVELLGPILWIWLKWVLFFFFMFLMYWAGFFYSSFAIFLAFAFLSIRIKWKWGDENGKKTIAKFDWLSCLSLAQNFVGCSASMLSNSNGVNFKSRLWFVLLNLRRHLTPSFDASISHLFSKWIFLYFEAVIISSMILSF